LPPSHHDLVQLKCLISSTQKTQPYSHQQTHNGAQLLCRSDCLFQFYILYHLFTSTASPIHAQPGPGFLLAPLCEGEVLSPCFAHVFHSQAQCCGALSRRHRWSELTHTQPLDHLLGSQGCFLGGASLQQLPSLSATAMAAARQSRHLSKRD